MLIGSNYLVWKSMIRDMLVCKDLWLPVQFGDKRPNKIDVSTWEVVHLKVAGSLYKMFYRHESI